MMNSILGQTENRRSHLAPSTKKLAMQARTTEKQIAINEALELFHRRWILRVIWELRDGPQTFRALQARGGDLSPTVLNQRLRDLRDAALVVKSADGYELTNLGSDLLESFEPVFKWSQRWRRSMLRKAAR